MRYRILSKGNGAMFDITRLTDGATLFLQGGDAVEFDSELDATTERRTADDVCDDYAELFVKGGE